MIKYVFYNNSQLNMGLDQQNENIFFQFSTFSTVDFKSMSQRKFYLQGCASPGGTTSELWERDPESWSLVQEEFSFKKKIT